ncbi:MAG: WD40 repeat domain-containing protein [Planctomycetes bacterium]|nr:WD40 repeat domain-containing protein [Planctomycetota bacterium]
MRLFCAAVAILWSLQTGADLPKGAATSVAPLRDSGWIAAWGGEVVVLEGGAPAARATVPGFERITALAMAPDGRRAALAGGVPGRFGSAALYDVGERRVVTICESVQFKDVATCAGFTADGSKLLVGSADGTAALIDARTHKKLHELRGHTGPILACAVKDGILVTGSADRTLRVWSESGELLRTLTQHSGAVNALTFEPGGRRLVSAADDRTVRLWDPFVGRMIRSFRGFPGGATALLWPLPEELLVGATDGRLRRIALPDGVLTDVEAPRESGWIYGVAVRPGSSKGAVALAGTHGVTAAPR